MAINRERELERAQVATIRAKLAAKKRGGNDTTPQDDELPSPWCKPRLPGR